MQQQKYIKKQKKNWEKREKTTLPFNFHANFLVLIWLVQNLTYQVGGAGNPKPFLSRTK